MIITLLTGAFLALLSTVASGSELIEIQLMDKLDETRSFCIDIKGYKERAKVHRGLQAHTCYSYQGQLGVDQAFNKDLVQFGRFYMPAFGVCMEAKNHNEGASLTLKDCNNKAVQKFDFTTENQIKILGKHDLCVAVESGNSRQGGGGTPPHLIRTLQLKSCSLTDFKYTAWKIK
jgi:hypothetical protein